MLGVVAIYCRLSREDEKLGESGSIKMQKSILTEYVKNNNSSIYKIYVDDGYSGTTFDRPGFKEMLKDAKMKLFNTIVVKDLSRFGRNYIKTGYYLEEFFPERNIRIIAVNDNFDSIKNDNDFVPFKNIINEWYTKDISKKIRLTHKIHQEKGIIPTGKIPLYGYKYDEFRNRIIDNETAPIVKQIFNWYIKGLTIKMICEKLKEKKVVVPGYYYYQKYNYNEKKYSSYEDEKKYLWTRPMIEKIISKDEYSGDLYLAKTHVKSFKNKKIVTNPKEEQVYFKEKFEGIISKDIYVNALARKNLNCRDKKDVKENIYRGIIKCYTCHKTMTFRTLKSKNNKYFCFGCRNKECIDHSLIRIDDIVEVINNEISNLVFIINDENKLIKYIEQFFKEKLKTLRKKDYSNEINILKLRNTKLEKLIEKLYLDNIDDSLPILAYEKMKKKYNDEYKGNLKRIDELVKLNENEKIDYKKLTIDFINSIKKLNKAKLMNIFEKIEVYKKRKTKGKVKFYYKGFGLLIEEFRYGFNK